jgi:uncharacterized protein (DUF1810 family)
MEDPYDLQRFVAAQAPVYDEVRAELRRGRKTSHWMWFIFPQIAGLGHSLMAQRYAIASLNEARAYLAHPLLGPRLRECAALVTAVEARPLRAILGAPDDLKFHSSMTLFARASDNDPVFAAALGKYFAATPDPETLKILPPLPKGEGGAHGGAMGG